MNRKIFTLIMFSGILIFTAIFAGGGYYPEKPYLPASSQKPQTEPKGEEIIIENIIAIPQLPDFPTGCESVALCVLLRHYGAGVTVDMIADELPKGPLPYEFAGDFFGADPEEEFVGDPRKEDSYGVFEKPIETVASRFFSGAKSKRGADLDEVLEIISGGDPVMAWCAVDENKAIEYRRRWKSITTGEEIVWGSGEHAVVVYGFTDQKLYISDPMTGTLRDVQKSAFERGFSSLGGRIVYYET